MLGLGQTSNLTCAESNDNEQIILFNYLVSIRLGTCEVPRLNLALHWWTGEEK